MAQKSTPAKPLSACCSQERTMIHSCRSLLQIEGISACQASKASKTADMCSHRSLTPFGERTSWPQAESSLKAAHRA